MWVHILIFVLALGTAFVGRTGWILPEPLTDQKSVRLFILVAVCMNLLGMLLTFTGKGKEAEESSFRIAREEAGAYDQEYLLSVEGDEKSRAVTVHIPEKETEEQHSPMEEEGPIQSRQQEIWNMLDQYNSEKEDPDYYYLPKEWEGKKLSWKRPKDHTGELLASLGLVAAFAVLLKSTKEKQEKEMKRAEQLLADYPGLVMKFVLLIRAGMTARKAFRKIAADYKRRSPGAGRYAYEAIITACYEMDSGIAEAEAYRRFGERCGQMKYKTFSTLLIQNLQKGSRRLGDILEKEAMEAWEERKRKARVLGEAASTKLLVPMVMMLLVVMAIIMIPAFLSFYG